MSYSQIGGAIGAAVGYYVTGGTSQGAQWGYVIGSGVGAMAQPPQSIEGPRIGEALIIPAVHGPSWTDDEWSKP